MAGKEQDDGLKVITPEGRVAFPHVWEPHAFQAGQEPNYSLILVFPEGTDIMELKKACGRAAVKKFGDKARGMMKAGQLRMPWRDGSEYSEYGEPFVDGAIFVTAKSKQAPGVVNERAKPIMNQMDFYAGCMGRASVYCHAYDTMGNKGVTLLLNNVQKTGDGERMSGRQRAEDEFEPVKGAAGKGGAAADDMDDDIPF
jgi:hypothetical protein